MKKDELSKGITTYDGDTDSTPATERVDADKIKEILINPAVPPELQALAESATAALKAHTAEGKSIVLTELRKRFDVAIAELRAMGCDKTVPDEKMINLMSAAFGKGLTDIVVDEWAKAVGNAEPLEGLPNELTDVGKQQAVINIAEAVGRDAARAVFTSIFNKAYWEGVTFAGAIFANFKDDILIANEKDKS